MKFRTEYQTKPSGHRLDPEKTIVLMGSCFSDYIGQRMRLCRWRAFPNICGTLYNPKSIAGILRLICTWDSVFDIIKESIAERDRLFMSWLSDSDCSTYSRTDTEDRVFKRLIKLRRELGAAGTLIITFGTSWIYELIDRPGYVVTNCHKFPADKFLRRRLSVNEIVAEWNEIIAMLAGSFPDLRIIFTVSPVRHLKDGFEGNSRSKAILQLACEEICNDNKNVGYFPSFEIMNDDLRDYRFYSSDMVHPSPEAVEYIWEKFQQHYLSEASRSLLAEGEKVTRHINHRTIVHGNSDMADYTASVEKQKAIDRYNNFISAHPSMLHLDE